MTSLRRFAVRSKRALCGAASLFILCFAIVVGAASPSDASGTGILPPLTTGMEVDSSALESSLVEDGAKIGGPEAGALVLGAAVVSQVLMFWKPQTDLSQTVQVSSGSLAKAVAANGIPSNTASGGNGCNYAMPKTSTVTSYGVYTYPWTGLKPQVEVGYVFNPANHAACVVGYVITGSEYDFFPPQGTQSGAIAGTGMTVQLSGSYSGLHTTGGFGLTGTSATNSPYTYKLTTGTYLNLSFNWGANAPQPAPGYQIWTGADLGTPSQCSNGPVYATGTYGCDSVYTYPPSQPNVLNVPQATEYDETVVCTVTPPDPSIPDQTVTASWAADSVVVTPASCSSLAPPADGGAWTPKQITITTIGGPGAGTSTINVPTPTGNPVPIPGPPGQTVTGEQPDPKGNPVVTSTPSQPDPRENPDPGTEGDPGSDPNPLPDPGTDPSSKPCMTGFSFNPITWVKIPVECALEWAFVPDGDMPSIVAPSLAAWLVPFGSFSDSCSEWGAVLDFGTPPYHVEAPVNLPDTCSGIGAVVSGASRAIVAGSLGYIAAVRIYRRATRSLG